MTCPADCSSNYFCIKHCDGLVIRGVTGDGRAQTMVSEQANIFLFHHSCHA